MKYTMESFANTCESKDGCARRASFELKSTGKDSVVRSAGIYCSQHATQEMRSRNRDAILSESKQAKLASGA